MCFQRVLQDGNSSSSVAWVLQIFDILKNTYLCSFSRFIETFLLWGVFHYWSKLSVASPAPKKWGGPNHVSLLVSSKSYNIHTWGTPLYMWKKTFQRICANPKRGLNRSGGVRTPPFPPVATPLKVVELLIFCKFPSVFEGPNILRYFFETPEVRSILNECHNSLEQEYPFIFF